ncbi:DMT family transporter [Cognatishimia sp. F0-27]|uniref:DMT family transporter n=1 Tax=Cognatishimia sp. F0-27 TaxID=2816855 RepID=UPI001D0C4340|nr:DMT family transporter [Cognatishimia sp. F0-27]MCC1492245.1 DMT family transporter [Cognatishimia sp. F0-27]
MDLWIVATLAAALFQTFRFMLQKVLASGPLSATGSTFARFAYAIPGAVLVLAGYLWATGTLVPTVGSAFWGWAYLGGVSQILATVLVVLLFKSRNFAVGITLKKTEVIQTALLGLVLLGETITPGGWLAIGLGLAGVLMLSQTPGLVDDIWQALRSRAVLLGVASGFFFAISGIGYRAASLTVDSVDPLLRAGVTLLSVNVMQVLTLWPWLVWREPGQVVAVWRARKTAIWLGVTSMLGSLGWFTAFTLQTAAYVFALGQVELIFSLIASVVFFKETVTRREVTGIAILAASILLLVFLA